MISDIFSIYDWDVTVLYETTCDDIDFIIKTLKGINCPKMFINRALDNLEECKLNSGLTYSNSILKGHSLPNGTKLFGSFKQKSFFNMFISIILPRKLAKLYLHLQVKVIK